MVQTSGTLALGLRISAREVTMALPAPLSAWRLRPPEKCHQLGTSLGKTWVRGVSFLTALTISVRHHLRGPGLSELGAFL